MKQIIIILFLSISTLSGRAAIEKVKIHGEIIGSGDNEIVLLDADQSEITRVKAAGNKFEIIAEVETGDARFYTLYIPSVGPLGPSMSIPTLPLFIDSRDIEVKASIVDNQVRKEKIKGSPYLDEYEAIFQNLPVRKEIDEAMPRYNRAFEQYNSVAQTEENRKTLTEAGNLMDSLQSLETQQILQLIPTHTKSKVLALIISFYFYNEPVNELEAIKNQFDASIQDCYGLKQLGKKIDLTKACAVGQPAPEFELKDLDGKTVKLSSLRGKYTLIDFWASWCGPCRKEIPNLKKVYAAYKDRGLQLVGVSVDDSDSRWRKAVQEEQLDYLQLHDPTSVTGKLYGYSGIPFIILLSPEGIILEKNLRGPEVGGKVAQYIH